MSLADDITDALGEMRAEIGTTVMYGGKPYRAVAAAAKNDPTDLLPGTAGINAADADLRVFNVGPPGVPGGLPRVPNAQERLIWQGRDYTLLADARPEDVGGSVISLRLLCYRTPQPDAPRLDTGPDIWTQREVTL